LHQGRNAGTGTVHEWSVAPANIVAEFLSTRREFQSRVAGATNVVVGNTDLTGPGAPI